MLNLLNHPLDSEEVQRLLEDLNTLRRPSKPEDGSPYYDWVLVKKKGIELGFVDSKYQGGVARGLWGKGEWLLVQFYFYAGFDDVRTYGGGLPFDLQWTDTREQVNGKMLAFESTRHSSITDTWDTRDYRLTACYRGKTKELERLFCRKMPDMLVGPKEISWPALDDVVGAFGCDVSEAQFKRLWGTHLTESKLALALTEEEIDFRTTFGASIGVANSGSEALFRSIALHRNRDLDSVAWAGSLPHGLAFEDSPATLFLKVKLKPAKREVSNTTGFAVWHFDGYSMHVLYSTVDNRLLRVKLLAPGTWKSVDDV